MLISKTVLLSAMISLSLHAGGVFLALNASPAAQVISSQNEDCADTEIVFIDYKGYCEPMFAQENVKSKIEEIKTETREDGISVNAVKKDAAAADDADNHGKNHDDESAEENENRRHSPAGADIWKIVKCPPPVYPQESKKLGEYGETVVKLIINPDGKIENAEIMSSSGYKRLDEAALKSAKKITLKYFGKSGPANRIILQIPYQFKLKET
jgi:TonB family protein